VQHNRVYAAPLFLCISLLIDSFIVHQPDARGKPMNDSIQEPLLDRRGIAEYAVKELGIRIPISTINKMAMMGKGPEPCLFYGRRQLYDRKQVRKWILSLTSRAPRIVGTAGRAKPVDPPAKAVRANKERQKGRRG
jgi:hypothetical protein